MEHLQHQNRDAVVFRWRPQSSCVGLARLELSKALVGWGLSTLNDSAVLVLSELVTNAVTHARVRGREIETRFLPTADGVRIEVHDASSVQPRQAVLDAARESEGGRGLVIVAALADHWGVQHRNSVGKLIWATLTPPGPNGGARHGG